VEFHETTTMPYPGATRNRGTKKSAFANDRRNRINTSGAK
jgi:hypothetical protein